MIIELIVYFGGKKLDKHFEQDPVGHANSNKRKSRVTKLREPNVGAETMHTCIFPIFYEKSFILEKLNSIRIPIFLKSPNRKPDGR